MKAIFGLLGIICATLALIYTLNTFGKINDMVVHKAIMENSGK